MKFDLVAPCAQCPFRSDRAPFITADRAEEICESITADQAPFPCHKTVTYSDDDGERIRSRDEQHCAGASIMLERMERPNQHMRVAERLGLYDRHKLKMKSPVFSTPREMIAHHENGRLGKRVASKPARPDRALPASAASRREGSPTVKALSTVPRRRRKS